MPDYSKGKIYRIVCNNTGDQYIGSTCCTLSQRLSQHKSEYKKYLNGNKKHIVTSFQIIEKNNYEIVLIEYVNCSDKNELHQRERYYIENNKCVNKYIPLQTDREYYLKNIEKRREQNENYRILNKVFTARVFWEYVIHYSDILYRYNSIHVSFSYMLLLEI